MLKWKDIYFVKSRFIVHCINGVEVREWSIKQANCLSYISSKVHDITLIEVFCSCRKVRRIIFAKKNFHEINAMKNEIYEKVRKSLGRL